METSTNKEHTRTCVWYIGPPTYNIHLRRQVLPLFDIIL